MYDTVQHSNGSTKAIGLLTAAALTVGMGYMLAKGMNVDVAKIAENAMEMVLIQPPEPPPPVKEPEKPKVEVKQTVEAPPPPLVAPDIPFVPETPPVITAPVAEAAPEPPAPITAPAPSVGTDRVAPRLREADKPVYPAAARRAGEQGTTHLEVCVSPAGRVTSVSIAGSSGSKQLDSAAAQWIKTEKFAPGTIGGVPQQMCGHDVYYQWSLKDA